MAWASGCNVYDPSLLVVRDSGSDGGGDAGSDARVPDAGEGGIDAGPDAGVDGGGGMEMCNGEDDDGNGLVDDGDGPQQDCLERFTHVADAICRNATCYRSHPEACESGWCDCTGRGVINDCDTPFGEADQPNCQCAQPLAPDDAGVDASTDGGPDAAVDGGPGV